MASPISLLNSGCFVPSSRGHSRLLPLRLSVELLPPSSSSGANILTFSPLERNCQKSDYLTFQIPVELSVLLLYCIIIYFSDACCTLRANLFTGPLLGLCSLLGLCCPSLHPTSIPVCSLDEFFQSCVEKTLVHFFRHAP